jgi:uncharacterized protein YbcV (DUF1398 family)
MRHTAVWSCTHIPNIIDLSRKTKYYGLDNTILFKKQLFDLEVKVPRRSLRYVAHCLMVMLPHQINTIQKTIIWPWGQRSRSHECHYGTRHTALWSCTHIPNIIDLSRKTKYYGLDNTILFKKQLFDLEVKVPRRSLRYATHRLMVMHPHTK